MTVTYVQVDVKLADDVILRDKFDWDLALVKIRPIDFATQLVAKLPYPDKPAAASQISNQILDQIDAHIQKHTHFPRQRLNKREEEMIQQQGICILCNSLLKRDSEFCFQCCTQFDKRPNAKEPTLDQYQLTKTYRR